jgi:NADH dehydrogenase (ubiquinone) 1 alpha subcomplex subunit 6
MGLRGVNRGRNLETPREPVCSSTSLFYPQCPDIVQFQFLDITPAQMRARVRLEFDRNSTETSLPVINRLIFKGEKDMEEMMNQWQQKTHVMRFFENDWRGQDEAPKSFLEKFYEGR